jgi:predicted component of viral defense system (DUF524 family)
VAEVREVLLELPKRGAVSELRLRVALLPNRGPREETDRLLDLRGVTDRDETLHPVQLLEGAEYRYEFLGVPVGADISTDRPEVFAPDDYTGRTGRLRPGLYTGSMSAKVFQGTTQIGVAAFEVRSRKLDYLTDYRRMLSELAEVATEAIMEEFAVSEQSFVTSEGGEPLTIYQRFAFLQSLLSQEAFIAALHQIIARPYQQWTTTHERQATDRGLRGGTQLTRQLSTPGPRLLWPGNPLNIDLPAVVRAPRTEATLDNTPNRFVKFALTGWRMVVQKMHDAMLGLESTGTTVRGLRESQVLLDSLDAFLAEELFREIGDLHVFPSGNQALQRREGYRDVLRAYVQLEVAALLSWKGGEDVYNAGLRDVATLYEYWAYIKLAQIVSLACESKLDMSSLLKRDGNGVGLELRRGLESALTSTTRRLGRQLTVTLMYNRRFRKSALGTEGSWTTEMQPDISVKIQVNTGALQLYEPVWLHFDAKYRIRRLEAFGAPSSDVKGGGPLDSNAGGVGGVAGAKREDLNKMHAYRDAIRASAGAFILYPGDETIPQYRAFHEVLPGLGAFPLRPNPSGDADGASDILAFVNDVLDHVADQASQHERARWWEHRVYGSRRPEVGLPAVSFLAQPPADARVLVGFVKSEEHLSWIHETGLYNLRADQRRGSVPRALLDSDLLLLWGNGLGQEVELWRVAETVEALSREDLLGMRYPRPGGERYYCLRLLDLIPTTAGAPTNRRRIEAVLKEIDATASYGTAQSLTWSQLWSYPV